MTVVRDPIEDRGPLQGLAAGLEALPTQTQLAYVTATDAPFLQAAWVDRLTQLIGSNDLAIPEVDGRLHPLAAVYRKDPALVAAVVLLAEARSRLIDLVERLATIRVEASLMVEADPTLGTLRNLNTPAEYERAFHDAGFLPQD